MAEKTSTDVIIGGKVYTLSGYEEQAYLQKVASYLNEKISRFEAMDSYHRISSDMKGTLLQLNIADDYFKSKEQIERLENELEAKEKEIYRLKHELISSQLKMEEDEKTLKELEDKNHALLKDKTELEELLEDA